ncbi:MAG: NADP-dependent oxidoreductase [Polyangiaceae bacterium]|jgi:NADPH-dependent curcumin reductase CurA
MPLRTNHQWLLARRPQGLISAADFRWTESEIGEPAEGEILVRNLCLSCDPTQRGWMAGDTYWPAVRIGDVMRSFAVGEVVASNIAKYRAGDWVQGLFGWQEYCAAREDDIYPILPVPQGVSVESALSALGNTGMTAYFGLLDVGRPRPGETVVVSAAAGATGSAVGQIAKAKGCRAIGIAGGPDKCGWLTRELGFDAAIDYKSENVMTRLRQTCPDGIDIYFDNVGGRILDAALAHLALHGRVVVCGAMSSYNDVAGMTGPRNYLRLLVQRGRMEGFVVIDYLDRAPEAIAQLRQWLLEGKLKDRVDVQRGLENAPAVVARLFAGQNQGKQLLSIADPTNAP